MKESVKKSKIWIISFALSVVLGGLSGCSKDPLVRIKTATLDLADKKNMYEEIRARNRNLKSFRSLAQVRLGSGILSERGRVSFAYIRPSWIRFDGLSDLGVQDPQILVKMGDVLIYWPSQNKYYRGLASDTVMAKYFHFSMHPEQVGEILSGVIPLDDIQAYQAATITGIDDHYLFRSETREMIVFEKDGHFFPKRFIEKSMDGLKRYRVDYSDYRDTGNGWAPAHVKVQFWDPDLNAEVWYSGSELNPPTEKLDKKDFEIRIPSDAVQIQD